MEVWWMLKPRCLIRREICEDGVERSVYRAMGTRKYQFHPGGRQASTQHFRSCAIATAYENELIFRGLLLDSVANERAAYANAVGIPTEYP